jgi:pimeloyl-ACP methyl ester carboxylesterase
MKRFLSEQFTSSGVRLRLQKQNPGTLNWLLLPGGPGLGSESLIELADVMDVPGKVWLVDLPGDGSNVSEASRDSYQKWPEVLLEAMDVLKDCVYVGHSTGGMYLLSVPELENRLRGLVLISSAPDTSWHGKFEQMCAENPLPEFSRVVQVFESERNNENLRQLVVASADWNFFPKSLAAGSAMLARMPINLKAVDWSDRNFDRTYKMKWWPRKLPTLILSGNQDRIVDQTLWDQEQFRGKNILWRRIEDAAHFPWFEQPEAVSAAFKELLSHE